MPKIRVVQRCKDFDRISFEISSDWRFLSEEKRKYIVRKIASFTKDMVEEDYINILDRMTCDDMVEFLHSYTSVDKEYYSHYHHKDLATAILLATYRQQSVFYDEEYNLIDAAIKEWLKMMDYKHQEKLVNLWKEL